MSYPGSPIKSVNIRMQGAELDETGTAYKGVDVPFQMRAESNLASDTRSWGGSDFNGVNAPASLDGTSVTIGGQATFIDFISPTQVNPLVPSTVGTGLQQVTVTTPTGVSAPFNITVNALQPGLLAPSSFAVKGTQYAVATFSDGAYAHPAGAISSVDASTLDSWTS